MQVPTGRFEYITCYLKKITCSANVWRSYFWNNIYESIPPHTFILASLPHFSAFHCTSCFLSFSRSFSRSAQQAFNPLFSSSRLFITSLFCSSFFCAHSSVSCRTVPQGPINKKKWELISKYKLCSFTLTAASSIFDGQGHLCTFIGLFHAGGRVIFFSWMTALMSTHLQRAH